MSALVEATGVAKRFGGLQALENVSFSIAAREIYGLIGPNGAGKTTLFNLLTGVYAPDAGGFHFDGRPLRGLAPHAIAAAGIARTFQNIRLFSNLSALENVMIGRHVRTHAGVIGAVLRTRGTLRRVSVSYVSRLAVSAGRAAFLAPLAATRPARRVGPTMWNFSMSPLPIDGLMDDLPAPQQHGARDAGIVLPDLRNFQARAFSVPAYRLELSASDLDRQSYS